MWHNIESASALNSILSGSAEDSPRFFLIFKHSTRCSISSMAKSRVEKGQDDRISYYLIDVIGNREVSNLLAELSGVRHESPQAFLYQGSNLIEVTSHMAIRSGEISTHVDSLIQNQT